MKTARIDPFQAECLAAFDGIKKIHGSPMTVAHQQQSDGLVGDIFGGEEMAAFANQLLMKPQSGCMMFIARVP